MIRCCRLLGMVLQIQVFIVPIHVQVTCNPTISVRRCLAGPSMWFPAEPWLLKAVDFDLSKPPLYQHLTEDLPQTVRPPSYPTVFPLPKPTMQKVRCHPKRCTFHVHQVWVNEWVSEWVSECVRDWVSEWGREGGREWVSAWVKTCMPEGGPWKAQVKKSCLYIIRDFCFRKILNIPHSFVSRISNKIVLEQSGRQEISSILTYRQLMLFGKSAALPSTDVRRQCVFWSNPSAPDCWTAAAPRTPKKFLGVKGVQTCSRCGRGCWPWWGLVFQLKAVENLGAILLFCTRPIERLCAMPMCHWREALKWKKKDFRPSESKTAVLQKIVNQNFQRWTTKRLRVPHATNYHCGRTLKKKLLKMCLSNVDLQDPLQKFINAGIDVCNRLARPVPTVNASNWFIPKKNPGHVLASFEFACAGRGADPSNLPGKQAGQLVERFLGTNSMLAQPIATSAS